MLLVRCSILAVALLSASSMADVAYADIGNKPYYWDGSGLASSRPNTSSSNCPRTSDSNSGNSTTHNASRSASSRMSSWYAFAPYTGWRYGLGIYVAEGMYCYADNLALQLEWRGAVQQSSDAAIQSALEACTNDPIMASQDPQGSCIIRTCERY